MSSTSSTSSTSSNVTTLAGEQVQHGSRGRRIGVVVATLVVAGVLGMGAFHKFFNYTPEGSQALAAALGVGRGVILTIGAVEAAAVALVLFPATRAIGGLLAAATMAGALFSHATRIGFSGNAAAEMWPLALIALLAAAFVTWARRSELPLLRR